MKLTIKLLPPYRKKGEPDEHPILIEEQPVDLQQLAVHLSRKWKDRLGYALIDDKKLLTAEFLINGKHVPLETVLEEGDQITIIPYICGG